MSTTETKPESSESAPALAPKVAVAVPPPRAVTSKLSFAALSAGQAKVDSKAEVLVEPMAHVFAKPEIKTVVEIKPVDSKPSSRPRFESSPASKKIVVSSAAAVPSATIVPSAAAPERRYFYCHLIKFYCYYLFISSSIY